MIRPVAAGRGAAGRGALPADVERLVAALVSPRVGVIEHLARMLHGAAAPPGVVMYQALLSHFEFRKSELHERAGIGKGETEAEAIRGAIGEAIEQYCACHIPPGAVVEAAYRDLGDRALDPSAGVLYAESQYARPDFPYHRCWPTTPLGWVRGRRLRPPGRRSDEAAASPATTASSGAELPAQAALAPGGPADADAGPGGEADEVLVPATLVYMNHHGETPESQIVAVTSNGLAAGPSLAFATLRGLGEVVERDAFMLTWLNRLPARRVSLAGLAGLPRTIRAHFARLGVEVVVLHVSVDIPIPVMAAVALDPAGHGPAAVFGLGCDLSPAVAVRKALLELCQVYPGELMRLHDSPPAARLRAWDDVREMADHSALFALPHLRPELDFLLANPAEQSLDAIADLATGHVETDLATCLGLLDRAGSAAIVVDVTTPDIAPLGLHVVRVLCPHLQPIHFGHGEARLGGERAYTIAQTLGHADRHRTEAELNPCPHPLA